jgi:NAD(P)-dependent dehydrogenase (short-subunit alcohol dehydrogenase family)
MIDLNGKSALVTGGSRGIGRACCVMLARAGAAVAVNYRVESPSANLLVEEIEAMGGEAFALAADVSKREDAEMLVDETVARLGSIDILVNNAGGALHTPHVLEQIQEHEWNLVLDVNLKGTFLCCQAVIPEMARQGKGVIVNMSALAGHWRASLAGVQYVAAKAGVEGLTRQLAYDWGKSGIRVNAIAPTVTLTGDRIQGLWEAKSEEEKRKVISAIPLGRLGTPEEVAAAVVFLASDESSFITGITLDVNGGRYLR